MVSALQLRSLKMHSDTYRGMQLVHLCRICDSKTLLDCYVKRELKIFAVSCTVPVFPPLPI